MRRLPTLLVLSVCAFSMACSGSVEAPSASTDNAIIGGTTDANDPAIVELDEETRNDGFTCTATFISTTVLLTAAHCVVEDNNPHKIPPTAKFRVMRARSAGAAKAADWITVRTANIHPHPGYDGDAAHDVAILVLDQPVAVTPIPIRRTPITKADIGSAVRLVGYGQATRKAGPNDGSETKRSVATTLRGLDGNLVLIGKTGQQACDGDSGGPALLVTDGVETLIATDDLAATKVDCAGGDLYQRVDLHLSFIDKYL